MKKFYLFFICCCMAIMTATSPVLAQEAEPSLERKIGQMIMVGFRGEGPTTAKVLLRDINMHYIGGVILFEKDVLRPQAIRNIVSKEQVTDLIACLQHCSKTPLFVAIDQEGGRVSRFKPSHGFAGTPSAQKLGEGTSCAALTAGEVTGKYLSEVGVNVNFAPVLDVNVNKESPVIGGIERSFSDDPDKVAEYGHAFAEGMARHGVVSVYKHFPGHGSAKTDSHKGLPDITRTWTKKELIPYKQLIGKEPLHMIMIAHLFNKRLDPKNPTTLSYAVVTKLLREKMKYDGVVVTDDLQMKAITNEMTVSEAAVKAVAAGNDILLIGNNIAYDPEVVKKVISAVVWAVHSGELSEDRIQQSYDRIMAAKKAAGLLVTQDSSEKNEVAEATGKEGSDAITEAVTE